MSKPTPQGLLLVLAQNEPDVSTEKFNEWYEAENARALSAVPRAPPALRYRATDGQKPEWAILYDLESPDEANSSDSACLRDAMPESCKTVVQQLPVFQHRTYRLVDQRARDSGGLPAEHILVVHWFVEADVEAEFDKWYSEEHLGDVVSVPGCLRGRRYKLVESKDMAPTKGPVAFPHVVLYDWDIANYWDNISEKGQTSWTKRMLEKGKMEIRAYSRYRGVNE